MSANQKNRSRPMFECLENRCVLATGVRASLADGVLTVTGTARADHIAVKQWENIRVYDGGSQVWSGDAGRVHRIVIRAGDGNDVVHLDARGAEVRKPTTVYGGRGNDSLYGGRGDDHLIGEDGNDHLSGGRGDDRLSGGDGNDHLFGDDGDDTLYGGNGNDKLYGKDGDDKLYGGAGSDELYGGAGTNQLYGGTGYDILLVRPVAARLTPNSEFRVRDAEGAPSKDGQRYHAAKDWFAAGGSAVRSPIDGMIVEARPSRGNSGQVFGGTVKVQARNGKVWVFRHVDPSGVRVGQRVDAGRVIAHVTHWASGPSHVHIEVWKTLSGGYRFENMIDPMHYLNRFLDDE